MDKYIMVRTFCDKEEVANSIVNKLLKEKLVAGAQISSVNSVYWWNDELEKTKEYKLVFGTKLSKYKDIEKVIKELHDYEVCEISYNFIDGSKEFLNWIDKYVD